MSLDELTVKIDKPYPKIEKAKDDQMTVNILRNLAFGRGGEAFSAMQYIYQSVIADKTNPDIGEIFEEAGIVEMMHLDMLMHAISEFGGNPDYRDSQGTFFSAGQLNYTTKLKDMLDNNINGESNAVQSYTNASGKVNNESLKALLRRIAEDEQRHVEVFRHIRDSVQFMSI